MAVVESSTVIHAPVEKVMALARDVERFPEFMENVLSVEILEEEPNGRVVSRWKAAIPELRISETWTEEDRWDEEERTCRFRQVEGNYKTYEGLWTFSPVPEGTRFDSTLDIEYDVPLIGPLIKGIVAKKAKENLDATLAAIKKRAEEG